jgi:hypothetical protein
MTCSTCPISLICHAGLLKRLTLCPACGILQVIIVNICVTPIPYVKTLRIKCSRRRINPAVYRAWRKHDSDYAWLRIKDTGPWQINNVSSKKDIGLLTVRLCDRCVVKGIVG